ncbi:universal stress protein [Tritonibacter horizontis]|uniref:Universal stress protein family protein n=1 Tax=Tritonibacter horizontis TaxID=1768241 RepID=A0A132BTN7_9RHOB|nr:universal stress protein [Tritonibacter horizontis]KUP91177.1 universal stress protein family protein [Tritonibacter horizontis]
MTYKSILTMRTAVEGGTSALVQAEDMARRTGGHLDALCIGVDRARTGYYDASTAAIALTSLLEIAQTEMEEITADTKTRLQASDVPYAVISALAHQGELSRIVAHHARFSDLVVMDLPYREGQGTETETIIETALFDARSPVLVVPEDKSLPARPQTVIVAWDESIQALAAIRKSLPFLQSAALVRIAVIDPSQHGIERSDPGGMLCQMLARHGVTCEVDVLSKTLPRVSDVLRRHATDAGADLIVMGAYGHSRLRQLILGGTTRNMLEQSDLPVLLAH